MSSTDADQRTSPLPWTWDEVGTCHIRQEPFGCINDANGGTVADGVYESDAKAIIAALQPSAPASAAYEAANPLGGPAKVFEAIASRIRAGEDYYEVLRDYDLQHISPASAGVAMSQQEIADTLDIAECCVHDQIKNPNEREWAYGNLQKIRAMLAAAPLPPATENYRFKRYNDNAPASASGERPFLHAFSIKVGKDDGVWFLHGEELVPGLNLCGEDLGHVLADLLPAWKALHDIAPGQVPAPPAAPLPAATASHTSHTVTSSSMTVEHDRPISTNVVNAPASAGSAIRAAEDAIDLFLEYRDKHGHDEESAKAAAINEFAEAESEETRAAAPLPAATATSESFEAWLCREMPEGTVIGDPKWWAPRIARAFARSETPARGWNDPVVLAINAAIGRGLKHEFFHDGLSADLMDFSKEEAYIEGWRDALLEMADDLKAAADVSAAHGDRTKDLQRK